MTSRAAATRRGGRRALYFHGGLILTELALWVVAAVAGWLDSVAFVSHLSMAALVLASLSALQAAVVSSKVDSDT